jgi:hypothetical protein
MHPDSKKLQEIFTVMLKGLINQKTLPAITIEEFSQIIADHENQRDTAKYLNAKAEGKLPTITFNALAHADSDLLPDDVTVNFNEKMMYVVHRKDMKKWLESENDWPLPQDCLLSRWWPEIQRGNRDAEIDVTPPINKDYCFELEKDYWRISFNSRVYTIKQSIGMQYITHLIQRAYDDEPEIHVFDLYYLVHKKPAIQDNTLSRMTREQLIELGLDVTDIGEGLDLMTPEGGKWAGDQIRELKSLMEKAEVEGNASEALQIRASKEALEDHVKKAFGLSGRVRKSSDPIDRVRKSVSKAIENTLVKIGKSKGDELAIYLDDHLNKGISCSFRKDPNITWKIMKK